MTKLTERAIFLQAIEEENLDDRSAYLDDACGDDVVLRASVESLLKAHEGPAKLLDQPIGRGQGIVGMAATEVVEPIEHIGMKLGPYRLMEQIGEGGFGLVFVAQQDKPVERKVALKLVKPGSGSKEVIARFEAERQAVAMMNHPNIAQVFDAGVTADARPYFVMELVRGLPITEFCDNHELDIQQRLSLMIDVCSAVHHAHQKGVIHRDIKPSNVMVTLHDEKPVVKVIDFGVAKAIGQTLTDKTIYTRFFSMIGTPLYMSPEQAEMSGLDVDTRSDIYSLGVLLYELLVGTTPFDRERLDSAGYDELRRIIRDEDPPRPSTRLSTLGDTLSTVATTRRVQPTRLAMSIRGDLDWIVMKALEKDRGRRYESAAAFAADIKRFLQSQPIDARPPSRLYQFQKFSRRHRAAIITVSLVGITMLIGTAASLWQMNEAIEQRNQKEQALRQANEAKLKIEQFSENITRANSLIASAQSHVNAGRIDAAKLDYDDAVLQQPNYFQPWVARAQFHTGRQAWSEAAQDYSEALSLGAPTDTSSWWGTPTLFLLTGDADQHREMCQRMDRQLRELDDKPEWELLRDVSASGSYEYSISRKELSRLVESWLEYNEQAEMFQRHRPPRPEPFGPEPFGPDSFSPDSFGPDRRGPEQRRPDQRRPDQQRPERRGGGQARPPLPREVCLYIAGMTHLRSENYELAIERLTEAHADTRWPARDLTSAPSAIAYAKLGRIEEAEAEFAKSQSAVVRPSRNEFNDNFGPPNSPWFDIVEMKVMQAEAGRLFDSAGSFRPN
ncbi:serine/threonine protein kinase [Rubripirellula amarantea]|nr:serine/threonine protein kinase [Rubripirellula amarantea]